ELENHIDLEKAYIIGLCTILTDLTKDQYDMFNIIDTSTNPKMYRDKFKKDRNKYMELVENIINNRIESIDSRIPKIKGILLVRRQILKVLTKEMNRVLQKKENTNYRNSIILSLMHMYSNRLTGSTEHEQKYLALIRHALFSLIEKEKHMKIIQTN